MSTVRVIGSFLSPYVRKVLVFLELKGIAYEVVDIERDPAAAQYVQSVNGGNQTVPTVRFPDGSALTNPTIVQVRDHLGRLAA